MAWVRKSDTHIDEPWWRQLGKDGRLLWDGMLCKLNQARTNGVIHAWAVEDWTYYVGLKKQKEQTDAWKDLVAVGAWHDHVTIVDCEDCAEAARSFLGEDLPKGAFYHHAYLDTQPAAEELSDPMEKRRARRRKALQRDVELCTAVRTRDHDRCRYCNVAVNFKARTGDQSGTYDHIDPNDFGQQDKDGGNSFDKLVVACRRCNGIKRDRTPDEAGMPLLPAPSLLAAPGRSLAGDQDGPGTGQEPARKTTGSGQGSPDPGQASRGHAREAGPGQDGPGTGQEPARAGAGRAGAGQAGTTSGRAGAGRGRAGPGKAGGGPSRAKGRGGAPPRDATNTEVLEGSK